MSLLESCEHSGAGKFSLDDVWPIRVRAQFKISSVEFCDDHHTLSSFLFSALTPVFGPPLCQLLPGHLHESLKGPAGGPDTNPSTSATNRCRLNGPRGGVNAWRPSSQAIRVVPMAAISSSIAHTPSRARQPRGTALARPPPRDRRRGDRVSNCVVGSGGLRLPYSIIAEHSVEGCDHFSHDGDDDDLG